MEMVRAPVGVKRKKHCEFDAFAHTNFRCIQLRHATYSDVEISVARDKVRKWSVNSQRSWSEAWSLMHTMTSDEVWGAGRSHTVCVAWMNEMAKFFQEMLATFEPVVGLREDPSVVHYMLVYRSHVGDPSYLRMLRVYIGAFQKTLNVTIDAVIEYPVSTTALQMAANYESIPIFVLKTLLEGGAWVDTADDRGDTALMMCIHNKSSTSCGKMLELLDYGADIDCYNTSLQNVIHVAVLMGNVDALRIVLDARSDRIRRSTGLVKTYEYETRLVKETCLDPDPLHLPDSDHETPLAVLSKSHHMSIYTREDIVRLLVDAGAVADANIDKQNRMAIANKRGGGERPPCWGIINCQLLGELLVFITVHKEFYSVEVTVSLDMLVQCVDKEKSVMPPTSMMEFDIRLVFMRCTKKRIDFDAGVDGADFDLHFNICDSTGYNTSVAGYTSGSDYKIAIRFPRGPCPISYWIDTLPFEPVFITRIVVDKEYTLSHYAATTTCKELRRRLVYLARPLCNPLVKCVDGLTAAATLEKRFVSTVMTWDVKRLLAKMRRDENGMLTYIHRDALLLLTGFKTPTNTKQGKTKTNMKQLMKMKRSPFENLPDDVCKIILSFI